MKRVLILANFAAGFLQFRQETLTALLEEGFEVTVALPSDEKACEIEKLGAKVVDVPINRRGTNPVTDLRLLLRYRKLILCLSPDVVLTYTVKCNVYGGLACRMTKTPYFSTITGLGSGLNNDGLLKKLTVLLYRVGLKGCRTLFCQNSHVQKFVQENRLFCGKLVLLPGSGVNLQKHPVTPYPSEEEGIRICFLARLMREKGIGELLEAAEHLHGRHPNLTFHIAGMAEEEAWLSRVKALEEKGAVVYHGELSDVRELIGSSHASVMPSYQEGMCNALMESAAMGRALLVSDVPGCRETVAENGGLKFPVKSADGIERAVEAFLDLTSAEREAMGLVAREKMEREFDRRYVTEQMVAAVKSIEGKTRRNTK